MARSWDVDSGGTLTTNLYAWYSLEDLVDGHSGGFDLTNANTVAFNSGLIGNAADTGATNTNKKLSNGTFPTYGASGHWSIAGWANVTTAPTSGTDKIFFASNSHTSGSTNDVVYCIKYVNQAGTLKMNYARLREGVAWQDGLYTVTLTEGTWYHHVITYDGTSTRGYLNGSLVTGPTAYSGVGNNSFGQGIDIFSRGGGDFFSGLIDMVGFWSKALSTTEISDLYNGGVGNDYREPALTFRPKTVFF